MTTALSDSLRAAMGKTAPAPAAAAPADAVAEAVAAAAAAEAAEEFANGVKTDHLLGWSSHFAEALPGCVELKAFEAAIRNLVPTLGRCKRNSILQALLACARFGLIPDGRQAAIVAEGDQAVFIPMYQGYIDLMHRSGKVLSVRRGFIYRNEEWSYDPTAAPPDDFSHTPRPELPFAERGDRFLAYAFAWLVGPDGQPVRSQTVLMNQEEAEEIRDFHSRGYRRAEESGTRDSAWHTNFKAMWAKSPIRQLAKLVPMSAEVRALVAVDEAGDAGRMQVLLAPEPEPKALAAEAPAEQAAPAPKAGQAQRRLEAERRKLARRRGDRGGRAEQKRGKAA